MKWRQIKWYIRYYTQYFPFTINTLLCGIAVYISFRLLYQPLVTNDDPTATRPFLILMGKIALWFVLGLIVLSILSTFSSWIYYLWIRKKNNISLQVNFTTESIPGKRNKLFLNALLEGVQRPLLGFVKGRLIYDDHNMTGKFSLLSNKRNEKSIFRAAITGKSRIELPDIKEYQLKGSFVYFEDMLHLFSFAAAHPLAGSFYQPPVLARDEDKDVYPKQTESMDVRIDQLRRVEGEYHNYKDFESGDDVRRIVWKVYAKNRDLVVRVPEMFEPYASHLYFYASFYAAIKHQWINEDYFKEMLNYYKNNIWTVYDTLSKKEWALRYVPEQNLNVPEHLSEAEKSARIISNSDWQHSRSPLQYFNARKGAVLCVSSLTDVEELKSLLNQCDASTVIYLVKVSSVFKHFVAWNWLKRLIFLPPKDRLNRLRTKWVFSPTRLQIQKRERELEKALKESEVTYGVL